jgi:hypothetical protein
VWSEAGLQFEASSASGVDHWGQQLQQQHEQQQQQHPEQQQQEGGVEDGGEEAEGGWVPREQYTKLQHKLEAAKVRMKASRAGLCCVALSFVQTS